MSVDTPCTPDLEAAAKALALSVGDGVDPQCWERMTIPQRNRYRQRAKTTVEAYLQARLSA